MNPELQPQGRTPEKAERTERFSGWNIQLIIAVTLSLAGLVLLFLGFYHSPTGEIHNSVLIGFGEVSTFAGALFGVDWKYRNPPPPKGGEIKN